MGAGYDDIRDTPLRNMANHRRLCLGVMAVDLERVAANNDGGLRSRTSTGSIEIMGPHSSSTPARPHPICPPTAFENP